MAYFPVVDIMVEVTEKSETIFRVQAKELAHFPSQVAETYYDNVFKVEFFIDYNLAQVIVKAAPEK
jgi:hypothetical protein